MGGVTDFIDRGNYESRVNSNVIQSFLQKLLTNSLQSTYSKAKKWCENFMNYMNYMELCIDWLIWKKEKSFKNPSHFFSFLVVVFQFSINIKEFAQFVKLVDEMSCEDEGGGDEEEEDGQGGGDGLFWFFENFSDHFLIFAFFFLLSWILEFYDPTNEDQPSSSQTVEIQDGDEVYI